MVWKDWRSSTPGEPLAEVRIDADDYHREVARAEQDHTWEWPARTLARLVSERLHAEPGILGQWDCRLGWCAAWLKDFDIARLTFLHPANRTSGTDPFLQFGLKVRVADQDPQVLAEQITDSMRTADPKITADMIGGNEATATKLGFTYRRSDGW
jgi:hypothetical protein